MKQVMLGLLHMSPVDRAGPVSEISLFPTEISESGLEILPYEHFIPVTGMNGGMNSGGPDGIILHALLYFPHHKHLIQLTRHQYGIFALVSQTSFA